jgi:alpha-mannosidase
MDELLDLLDDGYPHFHLDGQTALIDDYLAVRPEREADIRRHAQAGRISVGPWLALVDEFLVSGETIVRALELGLRRARELGGGELIGYLPDQFGHIGQMPQLLAGAGIERAVVWRGVPRSVDRSVFWWESPDESRVLVEYLPGGYSLGSRLRDAEDLDAELDRLASLLAPFAARERVLVLAGMDHAPADRRLPERVAVAKADAEIGSLADHLATPVDDDLPVWRGELRSAARAHLLPGVYSTRIHQKQERGRTENLVERYAEPLAALVPGFEWPQEGLDRIWTLLVLNGAHDSVCGCSLDTVAGAVDARNAEAREAADRIVHAALGALGSQVRDAGVLRFNPSPFEREGVPGLGWRVDREATEAETSPVDLELAFVDESDVGDLYNFCPVKGGVQIRFAANADGLDVRVSATRRNGEPFARLDLEIDNRRPDHRLRLHVPLATAGRESIAASPFELVRRPLVGEGSELEAASPTWPARGFVLAGGVAVLSEGVIEYEVLERELAVTLLRCVGTISRASLTTRPEAAGPDIATPEAQMIGLTTLRLGILPRAEPVDLVPAWERFALPLLTARAVGGGTLAATGTLLDVRGTALSSVRRRDGEVEVTVWNPSTETVHAHVAGEAVDLPAARVLRLPVKLGSD